MQQTEILSMHWLIFQLVYVIILLLLSYCVSSLKKTKKKQLTAKAAVAIFWTVSNYSKEWKVGNYKRTNVDNISLELTSVW